MKGLVDNLRYWRAERPDEWKMDEFIREAERLLAENESLRAENEALKVHFEQLRNAASKVVDDYFDYLERYEIDSEDMGTMQKREYDLMSALNVAALNKSAKCLAEIRAQAVRDATNWLYKSGLGYASDCEHLQDYANKLESQAANGGEE